MLPSGTSKSESVVEKCEGSEAPINRLPEEILTAIFAYLKTDDKGRAAQVCRLWRGVLDHHSFWTRSKVRLDLDTASPDLISVLRKRRLRHVDIIRCSRQEAMNELVVALPDLRRLNLHTCLMTSSNFLDSDVAMHSSCLTTLSIDGLQCRFIPSIIGQLSKLEDLTLMGNVKDDFCRSHGHCLRRLKRLRISAAVLTDEGVKHLAGLASPLESTHADCTVEYLEIFHAYSLTDTALDYISRGFPRVKCLEIYFEGRIEYTSLRSLSQMPCLETVKCINSAGLWKSDLDYTGVISKSLTVLYFDAFQPFTHEHILNLLGCFPSLKRLHLVHVPVTEVTVLTVAEQFPDLEHFHVSAFLPRTQRRLEAINRGGFLS